MGLPFHSTSIDTDSTLHAHVDSVQDVRVICIPRFLCGELLHPCLSPCSLASLPFATSPTSVLLCSLSDLPHACYRAPRAVVLLTLAADQGCFSAGPACASHCPIWRVLARLLEGGLNEGRFTPISLMQHARHIGHMGWENNVFHSIRPEAHAYQTSGHICGLGTE